MDVFANLQGNDVGLHEIEAIFKAHGESNRDAF